MYTDSSLFSPNSVDKGTIAMLTVTEFHSGQIVLDLGCGYGVVGIYAAHFSGAENVTMVDVNPVAVELAKKNAGYNHADFKVPKSFIENGFRHLKYGGRMVMVTKRYQWYKNKMESVFGGVKVIEKNGYYIFISQKKQNRKAKISKKQRLSRKLQRKYG